MSPKIAQTPLHSTLSRLYGAVVGLRGWAYDHKLLKSKTAELPCICVGNVVAGGSGKTPFSQFIAQELLAARRHPAILLRGYRSGIRNPQVVEAHAPAAAVGDEAALHRFCLPAEIPVVVSPDRHAGISLLKEKTNTTVVVLDDGLQHRKLIPTLSFLLLDASSTATRQKWMAGNLLPAGYLREPLAAAIARCHAIVYVYRLHVDQPLLPHPQLETALPSLKFVLRPAHFTDVRSGTQLPLSAFCSRSVEACCAIANPETFFDLLQSLSIILTRSQSFADHHEFSPTELKNLLSPSEIPLLVTEKDAVKLRPHLAAISANSRPVFALALRGSIESSEEAALLASLLSGL